MRFRLSRRHAARLYSERMNAFVLAGGQSTRMGRDKARLLFEGQPLVVRALELLRSLGCRARICGSRSDLADFGETIPDRLGGCGPLGGIEAALAVSDTESNLFLPVDAPAVPPEFLRWMMQRHESSDAVATVPRLGDRPEPLCAIYSRRLLAGLTASLREGRFKIMTAVTRCAGAMGEAVDLFQVESVAAALPAGVWPSHPPLREWFRNVNTPAEYGIVQALRRHESGAKSPHPIS